MSGDSDKKKISSGKKTKARSAVAKKEETGTKTGKAKASVSESKKSVPRLRPKKGKTEVKVSEKKEIAVASEKVEEEKANSNVPEDTVAASEEKPAAKKEFEKGVYAILPLRDIVVFPNMIVPLFVGREKSVNALNEVINKDKPLLLVSQKDQAVDNPESGDLNAVGTIGYVLQLIRLPDGTMKILVEGISRARILEYTGRTDYFEGVAEPLVTEYDEKKIKPLVGSVLSQFEEYIKLNKRILPEVYVSISNVKDPVKVADLIASNISIKVTDKQKMLEMTSLKDRLELLFSLMEAEIGVLQVEKKIRGRVKKQMEKSQRDYYLNEQMKAIQKELNEGDNGDEYADLEKKIKTVGLSEEAREKAVAELKKLRSMSSMSAEATVIKNYLDWLVGVPWKKKTPLKTDLQKAIDIMNEDHYGLDKVKERISEFLAVQLKTNSVKGQILCLVGPPGVGKTSLGQSIARATGRKFVRASLGGMRDEAEIRGHRRTYIGALPGKIIQGMRKAKSRNPLFLLDEIDKLGSDYKGDPSSALLEVLDPEQNKNFNDHYLEVDYDLSDVMFVTTANSLNMPRPLIDRMEIIRISGYTEEEKINIAKQHLIDRQMKACGLKKGEWSIDDDALYDLVRYYTKEAGVRNLSREIANLTRKAVKELMMDKTLKKVVVTKDNLSKYAGVRKYDFGIIDSKSRVGVTNGLAWTEVGGDLLEIEALTMQGKGRILLTGQLGDVMKESAEIARSYIRSRAAEFGIKPKVFENSDMHIHAPEGATPKDGPSAGLAMCTSMVSALTKIPVKKDVAMTGEITLLGKALPIGGLKEKLLAALRGGIKTVLVPKENAKDLEEIPDNVKEGLKIILVESATDVLKYALEKPFKTAKGGKTKKKN